MCGRAVRGFFLLFGAYGLPGARQDGIGSYFPLESWFYASEYFAYYVPAALRAGNPHDGGAVRFQSVFPFDDRKFFGVFLFHQLYGGWHCSGASDGRTLCKTASPFLLCGEAAGKSGAACLPDFDVCTAVLHQLSSDQRHGAEVEFHVKYKNLAGGTVLEIGVPQPVRRRCL